MASSKVLIKSSSYLYRIPLSKSVGTDSARYRCPPHDHQHCKCCRIVAQPVLCIKAKHHLSLWDTPKVLERKAIGIILVSIANLIFLARTIAMAEGTSQVLLYAGAMTAFMGGLFVLFGLRKEYRLWHDFAKEKEKPVATEQKTQS